MVENYPDAQCIIAQSPSIHSHLISGLVKECGLDVKIAENQANEVMAASDILLIASGTATLQAAIIGTPMVIAYRVSWLTYQFATRLVKIPWIGLVNVVAGEFGCP